MAEDKIAVTGAGGQIGVELMFAQRKIHGNAGAEAGDLSE